MMPSASSSMYGGQWVSRQELNVPEKIRCDIGKEWKLSSEFSKNKLLDYVNRSRRGGRVTAANSGIACREHTGEPKLTQQCMGPCGKLYALSAFSKNTRIRGVNWCNECTDWQLANEPGWSPYPIPFSRPTEGEKLPNSSIAMKQETDTSANNIVGNNMWPVHLDDDEEGDGDDEGDGTTGSVTGSEAVTNTMRALSIVSGVETSEYGGSEITTAMTGSIPASSSSAAPGHVYGGPGLFGGPALFGGPTGSSAVMTDTASVSSRQPPRRGPIQEFNAWDPSGTLHRVSKAQTVVSETHTATTSKTIRSNGWAKPANRKCPPEPPSYLKAGKTATATETDVVHPTHLMDYQPPRSEDGESDDDI